MLRRMIGLILLASVAAGPLVAQDARLVPGARVRVTLRVEAPARAAPLVGVVMDATRDSLRMRTEHGPTWASPWAAVDELEVSGGKHVSGKRVLFGALLGTAGGIGAGALIGSVTDTCDDTFCLKELDIAMAGVAGGLVGLVAGTTVGILWRAERWEPARVPRPRQIGLRPTRSGLALVYTW